MNENYQFPSNENQLPIEPLKAPLFFSPIRRIIVSLASLFTISAILCAIVKVFGFFLPPFAIGIIGLVSYLIVQVFDLWAFTVIAPDRKSIIATNLLAYLITTAVTVACLILFAVFFGVQKGTVMYTWLFMPMKAFYYIGFTGTLLSALISGGIALMVSLILPFFIYVPDDDDEILEDDEIDEEFYIEEDNDDIDDDDQTE